MTTFTTGDRVEFVEPYPVYGILTGVRGTVTGTSHGYGGPLVSVHTDAGATVTAYARRLAKITPPVEPSPKFIVGQTVTLNESKSGRDAGTKAIVTAHRLSYSRPGEFIAYLTDLDGGEFQSFEYRLAAYEFAEGDHVVVSSPIYRTALATYEHDATTVKVGDTGVVEYAADNVGDCRVRFESGDWNYLASDGLTLLPEPKPAKPLIAVGDKFRVTDTDGGHGFPVGTVVTVANEDGEPDGVDQKAPLVTIGTDLDDPAWESGVTAYVYPEGSGYGTVNVEPFVPTVDDFAKGDFVIVDADAKTHDGGRVYYGEQVVAQVAYVASDDVYVERVDGDRKAQYVAPEYLTKTDAPTVTIDPAKIDALLAQIDDLRAAVAAMKSEG